MISKNKKLLDNLLKLHNRMQEGCYIDEILEEPVLNVQFILSKDIPDIAWNYAITDRVNKKIIQWTIQTSETHKKTPCIFSWSSLKKEIELFNFSVDEELESWMILDLTQLKEIEQPTAISKFKFILNDKPGNDFANVFSKMFKDEKINQHFETYYIPALSKFKITKDINVIHLIGYADNLPVVCATAYILNNFCGLYNVGTNIDFQNKNFGKWVSYKILNEAKQFGAISAFLQCEPGNFVEKMYSKIGFNTIGTPSLQIIK